MWLVLVTGIWVLLNLYVCNSRHHLSYGGCLEVEGGILLELLCAVFFDSCAQRYAHKYEQFLHLCLGGTETV